MRWARAVAAQPLWFLVDAGLGCFKKCMEHLWNAHLGKLPRAPELEAGNWR